MTIDDFEAALENLETAEDFLEYFRIGYAPPVVCVNRLHILQRFHDYLAAVDPMPDNADERWALYSRLLGRAYEDFVQSDALTEKVFRVFRAQSQQNVSVPLTQIEGLPRGVT